MLARWLAFAVLAGSAGCLSRPTGEVGQAWPIEGVVIEKSVATDVDGDGDLDLAITSAGASAATRGVYVLLGGPGFGDHVDGFVPTDTRPLALDLVDVGGSRDPELAVLVDLAGRDRVLLHEGTGVGRFAAEPWLKDLVDLVPNADGRNGVRLFDSDGDGRFNVGVHNGGLARIGEPEGFGAAPFFAMSLVAPEGPNNGNFVVINDLYVLPGATTADLVIEIYHGLHVYRGDGTDTYLASARLDLGATSGQHNAAVHADLDGDGVLEVIGVSNGGFMGGLALVGAGTALAYRGPAPGHHVIHEYTAGRLGQLDADTHPDLIVLEHWGDTEAALDRSALAMIGNLEVAPGTVSALSALALYRELGGSIPAIEAGDFDGDGREEVAVIAPDGTITCLRATSTALDDCAW